MSLKDYILALDFDGVLWDSVGECLLTLTETLKLGTPTGPVEEAFRRARWLVRTGGDFLLAYEMARDNPGADFSKTTRAEFSALRQEHRERCADFEHHFYACRQRLRQQERERWLAAQRPYLEVVDQVPELRASFRELVLVTTKDEASARELLASAHLEMPIWARETGVDKGEQVLDLCRQRRHRPENVLFIDDLLENLEQVTRVGARGFLANWGYNTPQERSLAQSRGILILAAEDLLGQLKVMVPNE